jgi:branched-chain amino acid transport system permease protein
LDQFFQHILNATILGGTYALLGIGLTLIFGIMRVVNFTHGELYTFGAYMLYMFVMTLGVHFFFGLVLAIVLGVLLGAVIEFVLLRPIRGADIDTTMLVMIGAWIALQSMEQFTWSGVAKSITMPFPADPLVIGSVSVSWGRVFVFAVAICLIVGSHALIHRTRLGKAMRATFQDRETAALIGLGCGGRCVAGADLRGVPDHGRFRRPEVLCDRDPGRPWKFLGCGAGWLCLGVR